MRKIIPISIDLYAEKCYNLTENTRTKCYNHRISDAIAGTDITFEKFNEKRIFFAKQNLKGDTEALKFFGLTKPPWHYEDEKPYEEAEAVCRVSSMLIFLSDLQ